MKRLKLSREEAAALAKIIQRALDSQAVPDDSAAKAVLEKLQKQMGSQQ